MNRRYLPLTMLTSFHRLRYYLDCLLPYLASLTPTPSEMEFLVDLLKNSEVVETMVVSEIDGAQPQAILRKKNDWSYWLPTAIASPAATPSTYVVTKTAITETETQPIMADSLTPAATATITPIPQQSGNGYSLLMQESEMDDEEALCVEGSRGLENDNWKHATFMPKKKKVLAGGGAEVDAKRGPAVVVIIEDSTFNTTTDTTTASAEEMMYPELAEDKKELIARPLKDARRPSMSRDDAALLLETSVFEAGEWSSDDITEEEITLVTPKPTPRHTSRPYDRNKMDAEVMEIINEGLYLYELGRHQKNTNGFRRGMKNQDKNLVIVRYVVFLIAENDD